MKKRHWLKCPNAVPQKAKFGPKYKWFKISSLEFFFWKYYFGHTTFLYSFKRAITWVFLISDLLAESLKAKKDHSFYNTVLLKKTSLILRTSTRLALGITCSRKKSQKPFWVYNFSDLAKFIYFLLRFQKTTTTITTKKQKPFALHHFLKAKNCIPVCIFLYIFISVYLLEKMFVPET